ncbi:conserved hypothetical protein [Stigmatella aurantiaca DW4/3-1]|uniref:Uncharacterized protein n=1 Tax=Stigmatella aurantiaca (strain DW4/3-1) TaxID=378806 RepID=Q08XX9_STIAD|nr:conserved hypothetical protein [Stigmatella aurantiaca DW4/3-1]
MPALPGHPPGQRIHRHQQHHRQRWQPPPPGERPRHPPARRHAGHGQGSQEHRPQPQVAESLSLPGPRGQLRHHPGPAHGVDQRHQVRREIAKPFRSQPRPSEVAKEQEEEAIQQGDASHRGQGAPPAEPPGSCHPHRQRRRQRQEHRNPIGMHPRGHTVEECRQRQASPRGALVRNVSQVEPEHRQQQPVRAQGRVAEAGRQDWGQGQQHAPQHPGHRARRCHRHQPGAEVTHQRIAQRQPRAGVLEIYRQPPREGLEPHRHPGNAVRERHPRSIGVEEVGHVAQGQPPRGLAQKEPAKEVHGPVALRQPVNARGRQHRPTAQPQEPPQPAQGGEPPGQAVEQHGAFVTAYGLREHGTSSNTRAQSPRSGQIEKQRLDGLGGGEHQPGLLGHRHPIARAHRHAVERPLPTRHLQPRVPARGQRVLGLLPLTQQGAVQPQVLVHLQRAVLPLRGHHQPEPPLALLLREGLLLVARRQPRALGENPDLQQVQFLSRRVLLAVPHARARRHPLHLPRAQDAHRAHAVPVLDGAREHIGDDLHVLVGVGAKASAGRHAVLVDDAQRAEVHVRRVVVTRERERMVGIQPAMVRMATLIRRSNGQHGGLLFPNLICEPSWGRVPSSTRSLGWEGRFHGWNNRRGGP